MATALRNSKSTMSSPWKPIPRIKYRANSYHRTEVIAHWKPKKWLPWQRPSTHQSGLPSNTWFLGPIRAHSPNGISIGSAAFYTDDRKVSLYILYNGTPLSPSKLPLPMGDLDPHLMHGSPGPPESSTQTASRSVQPFLQGSLVWQTDWQTDSNNRPHLRT